MLINFISIFIFFYRTLKDYKILGFPVKIDDKKYARNAFYFNLCFVCEAEARTVHYEPVVKKMSDFLVRTFVALLINLSIIPLTLIQSSRWPLK